MNAFWNAIVILPVLVLVGMHSVQAATYYYHNDHLGTPQVLTDENREVVWRAEYEPFGEATETLSIVEQNLRFPGQYFDRETGLHYNYFRDYDPRIGRYVQSDPIGLAGGLNAYTYVLNNPLRYIDPLGLDVTISFNPNSAAGAGHVGIGVNTTNTVGQRPQAGANPLSIISGRDVPGEISPDQATPQHVTIPTTSDQDQRAQQCIDQRTQQQQNYNLYNNNCAQFVQQCLNAAGINTSGTMFPRTLFHQLQQTTNGNP